MPKPALVPTAVWEMAEKKEMEQVVGLYGKTYHFWQVCPGSLLLLSVSVSTGEAVKGG